MCQCNKHWDCLLGFWGQVRDCTVKVDSNRLLKKQEQHKTLFMLLQVSLRTFYLASSLVYVFETAAWIETGTLIFVASHVF